ncbi:MAG: type II secretion system protein J [Planctomycetota bacterium]
MKRQEGYTLLEMSIAVAVTSLMIALVLSVGVETVGFASYADEDFSVQFEANRAFDRTTEILRKVGRNTVSGVTYPAISPDGSEISFRVLQDADGNGYPFDGTTGDLEWTSDVFTIRRDAADDTLYVFDQFGNRVWTLGRYVDEVQFEMVEQNNTLGIDEVSASISASHLANDGNEIRYTASGSIHMRN